MQEGREKPAGRRRSKRSAAGRMIKYIREALKSESEDSSDHDAEMQHHEGLSAPI